MRTVRTSVAAIAGPSRLRANDPCWCGRGAKLKRCHGAHERFRRPRVRPGTVSPRRAVPDHIDRPPYALDPADRGPSGPQIMRGPDLDRMRRAGRVAAEVLAETAAAVAPGVTTDRLDEVAHAAYLARGAYPSTVGYGTYTKSICTSVNDVVCHGIPDSRPLEPGDIVNIDVTAYIDGVHGDTSATFAVGGLDALDEPTRGLVEVTREATRRGIAAVTAGRPLREIGRAVETFAAAHGLGVVRDYGGHGIGARFHAEPHVNHVELRHDGYVLADGQCLTVEPMLTAGSVETTEWDDGWTVVTVDGLPSAQFEHTVCVGDDGPEILTFLPGTPDGWAPGPG